MGNISYNKHPLLHSSNIAQSSSSFYRNWKIFHLNDANEILLLLMILHPIIHQQKMWLYYTGSDILFWETVKINCGWTDVQTRLFFENNFGRRIMAKCAVSTHSKQTLCSQISAFAFPKAAWIFSNINSYKKSGSKGPPRPRSNFIVFVFIESFQIFRCLKSLISFFLVGLFVIFVC